MSWKRFGWILCGIAGLAAIAACTPAPPEPSVSNADSLAHTRSFGFTKAGMLRDMFRSET